MTEVTRVPLKPLAKGSLTKLWLGVIVAILLGGGLAWAALPKTLSIETLVEGEGPSPELGNLAFVKYTGTLASTGEEFDKWRPEQLPIPGIFPDGTAMEVQEGALIPGFLEALQKMQKGGKYKVYIPADQAYGATPPEGSNIPPNSDLIFEMELVDFFTREQVEQKIAIMQSALGQQAGPEGGAQGAPQQDTTIEEQPAPQAMPVPPPPVQVQPAPGQ